jgi:CysZ protein
MDALRGIALTLTTPRLWPLCLGPLLGALVAYAALGVGGYYLVLPHLLQWLDASGQWAFLAGLAAAVLWVLLFPFLFTLLAGGLFGLVFEPLSRAVERIAAGPDATLPEARLSWGVTVQDSIGRLLLNGTLGFGAFLLAFALGPVPGVLAAALIGLLDYTSPAYLRRGLTLGPQARRLLGRRDGATFGFAAVAGLLSLVPFLGVLMMPGLVAGGTLLALRREQASAPQ